MNGYRWSTLETGDWRLTREADDQIIGGVVFQDLGRRSWYVVSTHYDHGPEPVSGLTVGKRALEALVAEREGVSA